MIVVFGVALGAEPPWRWITHDQGLLSEHVDDLAVDPNGVVWIATHAGLYTWDGTRATRADGGVIDHEIIRLVVGRDGVVVAHESLGRGWSLGPDGIAPITEADGSEVTVADLELDEQGSVVALTATGVRPVIGSVLGAPLDLTVPDKGVLLRRGAVGRWIVGTRDAFWLVGRGVPPSPLGAAAFAVDAELAPDGSIWTLDNEGTVRRVSADGTVLAQTDIEGRGHAIALRGDEAWVALGTSLSIVQPDGSIRTWGPAEGVFTGGPLLVDAEGSVWLGTFRGLAQLPEPGAFLWTRRDGLPGEASWDVELGGDRLWVTTWSGLGWVDRAAWKAGTEPGPVVKNPTCLDGSGALWTVGTDGLDGAGLFVRYAADLRTWPASAYSHFRDGCVSAPDGRVWITARDGLYRTTGGGPPERLAVWPDESLERATKRVSLAADGTVWVGGARKVCGINLPGPWRCVDLPGRAWVSDVLVTGSEAVWVADIDQGVSRLDGDRLVPLPAAADLPSRHVLGLERSPGGGVWILGHGVVTRVAERPDVPAGWEVVEELAPWLGHLVSGAIDLVELPDGALWIAHNGGVTSVSASARIRPTEPPSVILHEVRVNGEATSARDLTLPAPDAIVGIRFSAASWRAPALLRYRLRVGEAAWGAPIEAGWFEVSGLPPGPHTVEIAASLDGLRWTEPPARLAFVVPRPWYGRPEPWGALAATMLVVGLIAQRVRLLLAMRLANLRTRIALDLHDQMGAGLGAIGLMAELLGQGVLPPAAASGTARRILATSGELGAGLRGIVWSLRPESLWSDELGRWLLERARALLPELDRIGAIEVQISSRREALDLEVLRAVQLIGLEALHNVAKHAHAGRVRIVLQPAGAAWRLVVEDDGVGIRAGTPDSLEGGNGLPGMRARAAEIDAVLQVGAGSGGGGVSVVLQFRPRRPRRWWRTG